MAVYRAGWIKAAIIVGGLGVAIGLLAEDAVIHGVIAAMVGLWVGVLTFLVQDARSAAGSPQQAVTAAAAVTAGCAAVIGLFMMLAEWALLLAFLFVVTSPAAARGYIVLARRITAWRRRQLDAVTTVLAGTVLAGTVLEGPGQRLPSQVPVRDLTDVELCHAWRTSSHALPQQGADLTRQAQLVTARQEYLDEIERRNPAGFRRWLAVHAQPDSDPIQYLRPTVELPTSQDGEP
ncbi:MAG TPA: hypothetical protein VLJ88_06360 [Propionibacteriaceae bacterium]|nr:hypothetical protein [Propionibacteriaceae bacterium]